MLIVRRRVGERFVIGGNVEVTVASVQRGAVRLAVVAPRGVSVLRGEVHDKIAASNAAAATIELDIYDLEKLIDAPAHTKEDSP